ncbi:MAG TPA: response regulator [bacterium]|nr:response regulator [bacterium]HPQ65530.1 response regulator [bacterium]
MRKNAVILAIDDEESILTLLGIHFRGLGLALETAGTGEEGLRKAKALKPDLILLDVALPDITGLDALQALKEDPELKRIPVIILSGYPLEEASNVFLEAGAADYILKTVRIRQVIEDVLSYLPAGENQ